MSLLPRLPLSRRAAVLVAFAGGLVLALAGPKADFLPGVWLGPLLFYVAVAFVDAGELAPTGAPTAEKRGRVRRFVRAGGIGLAFGFAANAATFRFVPDVIVRFTPLPWVAGALAVVLLALSHALRFFVAELAFRALARRGVPKPVAFAVGMYAGTFVPIVFPWTPAAGATTWPTIVQLAELVGDRGLTAIFAYTSAILGEALVMARRDRGFRAAVHPLLSALVVMAALLVYGRSRIRAIDAERAAAKTMRVALVQPSTKARERWEKGRGPLLLEKLSNLTRAAEAAGAELVVWPEAAYPYSMSETGRRAPIGVYAPLQDGVRGPVLMGTIMHRGHESMNSAVVVHGDGRVSAPYHKMHLLWFGETVPLADMWPWLRKTFARGVGLSPGAGQVLLEAGPVRAAVLNCFEDTVPAAGREAAAVSPNLLVNITNDAWFEGSQESDAHLRVAVMRAIETRRDMVRSVNYGPTTWVDAVGRIAGRVDPPVPGFLLAQPALLERAPTMYARFGDAPGIAIAVGAIALAVLKRRRNG